MTPATHKLRRLLVCGLLGSVFATLGINLWIVLGTKTQIISSVSELPRSGIGLVLGTNESTAIHRRSAKAYEVLRNDKVRTLLVSGNANNNQFDEATAIADQLKVLGAKPEQLELDGAATRTIHSIREYKRRYPGEAVLIISDDYHLARSVWLANKLGVKAIAIGADSGHSPRALKCQCREVLARVKAFLEIYLGSAS
jgi:SanA protein